MAESKQEFMASQESNPQAMAGHSAGVGGVLQFPKDIGVGDEALNHMSFEAMKVSGGVDTRSLKFQPTGGTVILPIPSGATTASYQQGWEQTGVGFNRAAAASTPIIQAALKGAVQTGLKGGNVIDNMKDAFASTQPKESTDTSSQVDSFGSSGASKTGPAGMGAEATGFAMALPGVSSLAEAAQFSIGRRALEQTMMSYSGPGFRNFSYNFSLRPTSQSESDVVEEIVRFFKIRSAPLQEATQFTRIYNIPEVFKIRYYYGSKEHDKINRVGHCALTDMTVTYGGDKFTTFAGNHAPVQVDLQLQFKEMELLNQQMVEEGY